MTWRADIIAALKKLGGTATLEDIYEKLPLTRKRAKNWQSTTRNTLQIHDPDSGSFKGNPSFQNKGLGVWMLRGSAKTAKPSRDKRKTKAKAKAKKASKRRK